MLTADAHFQVRIRLPPQLHRHLDQLADAFLIQHRKRIGLEDLGLLIVVLKLRIVVAGKTHRGLRQIVGAEAEELC